MEYIVLHDHRHGTDSYLVRCDREPTIDEVVAALDLDFEEEREDEGLTISQAINVPTIPTHPMEDSTGYVPVGLRED
jgi:hypothetical protein